MTKCARCGLPIENMASFVVIGDDVYCENCFSITVQFREDEEK